MDNVITIGKRLLPIEHIAFIEPYDPATNPKLQTSRSYKARVVLINRDSVLTEETPEAFAAAHGFRVLDGDHIATNPAIAFRVETFKAAEGFTPSKAYVTRLLWRDLDGNDQSKLLVAAPERVLAVVLRGEEPETASDQNSLPLISVDEATRRPSRRRQNGAGTDPAPQH